MKMSASSSRFMLESTRVLNNRAASSTFRSIHTSLSTLEESDSAYTRSSDRSNRSQRSKRNNEAQKQRRVTDTVLTASRLGRHAESIDKNTSDRYSGWKPTPGPSSRRQGGRPKLSHDAGKSMMRAIESENVGERLGQYSSGVLLKPLVRKKDTDDGFGASRGSSGSSISSRDFIAPRRSLMPGDFVELRRAGTAVGIVLPPPEDALRSDADAATPSRTSTGMRDLYVLVTSGQVVLYKDNDVMIQIPHVIEPNLVTTAAVLSKHYVVSSNSLDTPVNSDGTHDAHSFASTAEGDPVEGTAMQEEPVDIPRFEARAAICNILRILERQKEKELQRLLPSFQSLFLVDAATSGQSEEEVERLRRQRMDLRTGAITTFEAARLMHELSIRRAIRSGTDRRADVELTASTVYAAHTLLMSHPTHFLADALSHRTSQLFTCRSDDEKANLALVSGWMADDAGSEGQSYIDDFCSKASKLRRHFDANPPDTAGDPRIIDPPHSDSDLNIVWTSQDRSIIEFLQASLGSRREVQEDTHASLAMDIVKRAGAHFRMLPHPDTPELMDVEKATDILLAENGSDGERGGGLGRSILETVGTDVTAGADLQHALVLRFLMSIGALPPWQNPIRLDAGFRSATMGEDGGEPESVLSASKENDASGGGGADTLAKKFSLTLDEQVEAIRHDFGKDHTVYVIDDEGAFELDDGISIEPVAGKDQAWVHVHIADPTAWVQPDDELGQRAERRFQTLYFPEARWAMLPDEVVRSGVGLRAATDGDSKDGQRVMSFSALVDLSSGLVQGTKVRPAFVHDVRTISYNKVNSILADQNNASSDLSLLLSIATKLSENRTRSSAFHAYRPSSAVSVSPLPLPHVPVSASSLQKPYFFAGFPTINVSANTDRSTTSDGVPALSQFVVSELMILAGRVAASYSSDHNLAAAFRYQLRPESIEEAHEILALRSNLPSASGGGSLISEEGIVGHGLIPFETILSRELSISTSGYSVTPKEHFSLGITSPRSNLFQPPTKDAITSSGYLRSTSPLRRYPDMLSHWQIKHQLLHSKPRFAAIDIERILPQLERQETSAKQWMRSSERFWIHTLLQRNLLAGKDGVAEKMTATVALAEVRVNKSTLSGRVRVNIEELGLPADLEWDARERAPKGGERFKVRPVAVAMAGVRSGLTVSRV
ncbi:Exoribonuclease II, mitochondrial [Pseudozyma hubeiensis]|nr:Exoribonuclease II, mitochondrial [Pseudozyma hubeiensis]